MKFTAKKGVYHMREVYEIWKYEKGDNYRVDTCHSLKEAIREIVKLYRNKVINNSEDADRIYGIYYFIKVCGEFGNEYILGEY